MSPIKEVPRSFKKNRLIYKTNKLQRNYYRKYSRIACELVADLKKSAERTLDTTGLRTQLARLWNLRFLMAFLSSSREFTIQYLQQKKGQKKPSKLITEINLSIEGIYVVEKSSLNNPRVN
jgi:hypothetical protein